MQWSPVDGFLSTSRPAIASFRPPRQDRDREAFDWQRNDVFVAGRDGRLSHLAAISGGRGYGPESWCIPTTTVPCAVARQAEGSGSGTEALDVFVRDDHNRIRHARHEPTPSTPYIRPGVGCAGAAVFALLGRATWCRLYGVAGWADLGGDFDSAPSAAVKGNGVIVAARSGGQIFARTHSGLAWEGTWNVLAGDAWTSDPIIVAGSGHATVFAVNSASELHAIPTDRGTSVLLRTDVAGEPAALSWSSETFVVVQTSDNDLVFRLIDRAEPTSAWQSIGGGRRWSTPTALLWRRGAPRELDFTLRQYVFARDEAGELFYTARQLAGFDAGYTWREWQSIGGGELAEFAVAPRGVNELVVYARHPGTNQVYRHVLPT